MANHEQDKEWLDFKCDLDTFGRLRWTVSTLTNKAVFLDLNITLGNAGHFSFQT
jgi:hypothetical protein